MDFGWSIIDAERANIAEYALNNGVARYAQPAQDLNAAVGHTP
jgi:hypothetical protein